MSHNLLISEVLKAKHDIQMNEVQREVKMLTEQNQILSKKINESRMPPVDANGKLMNSVNISDIKRKMTQSDDSPIMTHSPNTSANNSLIRSTNGPVATTSNFYNDNQYNTGT